MEKLIRCCLVILAGALLLKFLVYTATVLDALVGPTSLFRTPLTAYAVGHTLGLLIRWVAFLGLAKLLWHYNRQRTRVA